MAIGDVTAYLTAGKAVLDIFKGIRSELPKTTATERVGDQIAQAEKGPGHQRGGTCQSPRLQALPLYVPAADHALAPKGKSLRLPQCRLQQHDSGSIWRRISGWWPSELDALATPLRSVNSSLLCWARLRLRRRPMLRLRLHRYVNGALEALPAVGQQLGHRRCIFLLGGLHDQDFADRRSH